MGKKKRQKTEERASFTDTFVAALFAQASGEAKVATTAAREVCAGLFERAFASATVEPETSETRAITADVLGIIGRSFITAGECLFLYRRGPGRRRGTGGAGFSLGRARNDRERRAGPTKQILPGRMQPSLECYPGIVFCTSGMPWKRPGHGRGLALWC